MSNQRGGSRRRGRDLIAVFLAIVVLAMVSCSPASAPQAKATTPPVATPSGTETQVAAKPSAPTPTTQPVADSRSGGVVAKGLYGDPASFDLQRESGANESSTLFNVYQGLVRLDPVQRQKIIPELAEKWDVSSDGRTYTFKFFKGIKWHDGQAFTMQDVQHSLGRMQNPKDYNTIAPRGQGLLAAMDTVEIAGGDAVRITTKYPSASFLLNLAVGWVVIAPKHILDAKGDMRRDLIGTGAFRLKAFNPNVSLELERNKDYYIKGAPYLDGIRFYTIKDDATRFSAFRTGKIQITFSGSKGLTPVDAEIVKKEMTGRATVYEHDAQTRYALVFNMKRESWSDVRVRKAVDLAFDRQAAIKVNGNRGHIGSIYVDPWGMKADELQKLPGYRQPKDADLAEAKRLLSEAGYPNGFKTTLLYQAGGAREAQSVVAKDQMAKIGIEADLVVLEQAAVFDRMTRGAFDTVAITWLDNTGDPDEALYTFYLTGGSRNYMGFSDKEVDDLIQKQSRTLDVESRKTTLSQIEKKIMDQVPMVIAFWDSFQTGAWNQVQNFRPGPGIHPWFKFDQMWLSR